VSDLNAALDFYCSKIGLQEAFRLINAEGKVWIVYLRVSDRTFIELFPGGNPASHAPGDAVGAVHFCLEVDSVEDAVALWKERGVNPISGPSVGMDQAAQAWFQDPDGNRFEIHQYLPGAKQLGEA
jgi:lactoylglutathione lyase